MEAHSRRMTFVLVIVLLTLAACAPAAIPTQPPAAATPTAPGAPTTAPTLPPPPTATNAPPTPMQVTPTLAPTETPIAEPVTFPSLFVGSGQCVGCHASLKDSRGNDISFDRLWAPSLHANAARDPYFKATVRSETEQHAELRDTIESTCSACHLPMARTTALAGNAPALMLDAGFLDPQNPLHDLGVDGVSCSFCHQVKPDGLGSAQSFSAGYKVDMTLPPGQRVLYGPFRVDDSVQQLKKSAVGFTVVQSDHLSKPEFCATCHTLHTPVVAAFAVGEGVPQRKPFPEQMQYQEWLSSAYNGKTTCQACHMPQVSGDAAIASVGQGLMRSPVFQHSFTGSNSYMIDLLGANATELGVTAPADSLGAASQRNQDFLKNKTAALDVTASQNADEIAVMVKITNKAGHKFPSGFPSRRAWIHLTVTDVTGKVVFESGQYDGSGKIVENDNDQDPTRYEPHYDTIMDPSQVQIFEAILGNTDGAVTTELMRASKYLKDNRLLPAGFDKTRAGADIQVAGEALNDVSFGGGTDMTLYHFVARDATGPFRVSVQLLFQPIGWRWAENLRAEDTAEAAAFRRYTSDLPPLPVVVAEVNGDVR